MGEFPASAGVFHQLIDSEVRSDSSSYGTISYFFPIAQAWLALSPVYALSWTALGAALHRARQRQGASRSASVWVAGLIATLALTLVPAHLFELR